MSGREARPSWVQIWCMTLGKSFNLPKCRFLHLRNRKMGVGEDLTCPQAGLHCKGHGLGLPVPGPGGGHVLAHGPGVPDHTSFLNVCTTWARRVKLDLHRCAPA